MNNQVAIIFDIDSTLVDVSNSYLEVIRLTASDFLGRKVTKQEVLNIKSQPGYNNDWDATVALVTPKVTSKQYQQIKSRFQEYYLGTRTKSGLINSEKLTLNKSLLAQLYQKYQLGIVTGRPKQEALYTLQRLKIINYFNSKAIICLEDSDKSKPDPGPLLLCQKRLQAKTCVYIGDSIDDMLAAQAAKMIGILINPQNINLLTQMLELKP